ncbi:MULTISPECIES: DUF1801 domain-containing protein [unclassified Leisingera]|uniref:DUF1801 domain-containing protein n=1 Tax=unclassified Leisingera TaxID=2614906 RepID=UPI00057CD5C5|nr:MULTISPECIES: DUF1801 domain-containing protein [unclassified Leisingera]KIC18337.1 hypothetical protein RA21_07960 [Leisingera sp. ANG-DT]KIC33005.1 hypothetical protein RA25_10955 [Leisingera sp. ANG-S5]
MKPAFANPEIEAAFAVSDPLAREGLLRLRQLIFETAAETPEAGRVEEVLRWGQPSYVTPETRTGSTIRLGVPKGARFALFVHCQSRLISEFALAFPAWDRFEGTRAVLFDDPQNVEPLRHGWLIKRALTYKIRAPLEIPA